MRKNLMLLVLAVALFHVSGLMPSAFAENPVCEAPLGELAAKPGAMELPGEADPLRGPTFLTCSANQTCPSPFDGPIACMGNTSCQVFSYQISCDGNVIDCPCSTAPSGCNDPLEWCVCRSHGHGYLYCRTNFC